MEIHACDSNPCSKYATCTNLPLAKFKCQCLPQFSGDGVQCAVQEGHKAVMVGGKLTIVPIVKGDGTPSPSVLPCAALC